MKLYRHLAWDGIRKNSRLYVPYLLTGVGAVSFFYILVALSRLPEGTLPGSGSVQVILNLGSFVLWVFSLLLLFYTHSFLIRRRNREFALYNVLGSEAALRVRFLPGIPHEAQRRGPGLHLHPGHHGAGDALLHHLPVFRRGGLPAHPLSPG